MADYFADAYFGSKYWTASYFQGGEADPNAISASLSGSGGLVATLTAVESTAIEYGSGPFTFPHRQFRIDDEDEREELRKEIVKIGTGTPQEVITGLVQRPNIKRRTPQVETLARLNAERLKAEAAKRDRIKRIIAQDDEWLMMA